MNTLEDLVLECTDFRGNMEHYIADICFEINKLKANYPEEYIDNLISKLTLLIKYCDEILVDNEDKRDKLDSSIRETAMLTSKLTIEIRRREAEMNRSLDIQEAETDEKVVLVNQIKELQERLHTSMGRCDSLMLENNTLLNELKDNKSKNNLLIEKNTIKDNTIANLKNNLDIVSNDFVKFKSNQSWCKNKWVEDTILNDYFSAMAENGSHSDILFLGPSVSLAIKFGTPDTTRECLKLTSYLECKYIFLCISDCGDASKEDNGSHWSLLFLNKCDNRAYHFDSLKPMNKESARIVAYNLGVGPDNVLEMPCIQQNKSFECGIHVLANAKYIAHHYCKNKPHIPFIDWISATKESGSNLASGHAQPRSDHSQYRKTARLIPIHQQSTTWRSVPIKKKFKRSGHTKKDSVKSIGTKNRFEVLDRITDNVGVISDYSGVLSVKHVNKNKLEVKLKSKNPATESSKLKELRVNHIKAKLIVSSDSQGRGLSTYLEHLNNDKFKIFNHCQPGARFQQIINSVTSTLEFKTLSKKDYIVIIGGTNDISEINLVNGHDYLRSFSDFLVDQLSLFKHTNLIFSTIPYRYDLSAASPENQMIKDVNIIIRQISYNQPHVNVLDLYLLRSCHHTKHGLHINRKGKTSLTREIIKLTDGFAKEGNDFPLRTQGTEVELCDICANNELAQNIHSSKPSLIENLTTKQKELPKVPATATLHQEKSLTNIGEKHLTTVTTPTRSSLRGPHTLLPPDCSASTPTSTLDSPFAGFSTPSSNNLILMEKVNRDRQLNLSMELKNLQILQPKTSM